eukprot:scaffold5228_cov89-Isochrysis_galbana.AAC.1
MHRGAVSAMSPRPKHTPSHSKAGPWRHGRGPHLVNVRRDLEGVPFSHARQNTASHLGPTCPHACLPRGTSHRLEAHRLIRQNLRHHTLGTARGVPSLRRPRERISRLELGAKARSQAEKHRTIVRRRRDAASALDSSVLWPLDRNHTEQVGDVTH